MTNNDGKVSHYPSWSIKETLLLGIVYLLLCISLRFALFQLLPDMPGLVKPSSDFLRMLSSTVLLIVCLTWLKFIKTDPIRSVGMVKCKLRNYLFALACAIGLYFGSMAVFKSFGINYQPGLLQERYTVERGLNYFLLAPFAEEIYFRGIFFQACKARFGLIIGVVLSGLLFGLLHFDPRCLAFWYLSIGSALFYGVIVAFLFHYSKSLLPPILCHSIYNLLSEYVGV